MQNSVSQVQIYDETDELVLELDLQQASSVTEQVGGDCFVKVVSDNIRGITLNPYSYIVYNGRRWYIRNFTSPQFEDGYYHYDISFYRPYNVLSNFVFARPVSVTDQHGVTTSWIEPNFSINANKKTMCELVISCIDKVVCQRFMNAFSSEFDRMSLPAGNDYNDTELKSFSFAGTTIKAALDEIARAYECDWWFANGYLYMEKYETNTIHTFAKGFNAGVGIAGNTSNGIATIKYSNQNQKATKLYFYGGTRNITPKQANENGLDISYDTRLRLQENHTYTIPLADGTTATLQTNERGGVGNDMGIEEVVIDEDVYPSIVFAISANPQKRNQASGKPYFICKATALNATTATLQALIQHATGVTPSIVFSSGNLNGMEFEVRFSTNAERFGDFDFTIVPIESDYALIPNDVLCPKQGDQFVLLGVVLTQEYIQQAQQRLAEKAYEKIQEYQLSQPVIDIKCEPRYIEENNVTLNLGDIVEVSDVYFAGGAVCRNRIEMMKYPVCSPNEVELKLSEKKVVGLIREREYQLEDLREWYERFISAVLGENRFITINTGEQVEALWQGVSLVPTGVNSESTYALASSVTKKVGNITLQKGSLLNKTGDSVVIPTTSVNTGELITGHTYGMFARWSDGEDTASVVIEDLQGIITSAATNNILLGKLYSVNDSWGWCYAGVKATTFTADGTMLAGDILPVDIADIQKRFSSAFGAIYVGEEIVLSDNAAQLLSKRIGGGGGAGKDGKSAYEIAVEQGFKGSVEEWLKSLKGNKGDKGDKGDAYTLTDADLSKIAEQAAKLIENAENISW